jgi:hypothetical protein
LDGPAWGEHCLQFVSTQMLCTLKTAEDDKRLLTLGNSLLVVLGFCVQDGLGQ